MDANALARRNIASTPYRGNARATTLARTRNSIFTYRARKTRHPRKKPHLWPNSGQRGWPFSLTKPQSHDARHRPTTAMLVSRGLTPRGLTTHACSAQACAAQACAGEKIAHAVPEPAANSNPPHEGATHEQPPPQPQTRHPAAERPAGRRLHPASRRTRAGRSPLAGEGEVPGARLPAPRGRPLVGPPHRRRVHGLALEPDRALRRARLAARLRNELHRHGRLGRALPHPHRPARSRPACSPWRS